MKIAPGETVACDKCGQPCPNNECVPYGSQTVCEDCAMNLLSPAKACDPWAVKMASSSFRTKADAVATLQGLEKKVYDLIVERKRLPFEDLPDMLLRPKSDVDRALATLRHMELIRGDRREDGRADCVLFDHERNRP